MQHIINFLLNPAFDAITALFLAVIWMLRDQKDKTRAQLVFALVLNLFYGVLLNIFMAREGSLFPWKYDYILFHMDQSLGIPSATIAGPLQGFWRVPLFVIYELMVPMMIAWFLVTRYRNLRGSVVLAYIAELVFGPLLYAIVPSCGPIYAFGKQWLNPPAVPADPIRLAGMPNAFPSLHVATAFVLVMFAPGKFWKLVALVFLAGTCLGILSTGEHYVIDLVPGFAFGAFAACAGMRNFRRAAVFLAVSLAWSLAVRFGFSTLIAYPIITRSFAFVTVVLGAMALFQQWRLNPPAADSLAAEAPVLRVHTAPESRNTRI